MIDFISFIYPSKQRIQKTWNETTITVDGYKEATNAGIMFQTNPSTVKKELVHTCDQHMELDWIFDVTNTYCKQVHIGNYILCETVPEWVDAIQECAQNVFLCTGKQEWIWLADRSTYILECEGKRRTVWIGEACTIREVFQNTCLKTLPTNSACGHAPNRLCALRAVHVQIGHAPPRVREPARVPNERYRSDSVGGRIGQNDDASEPLQDSQTETYSVYCL